MITLFGMASPNVTKISIMLEELGLRHEYRWVRVFREEQFSAEFLKLNPNHKVPVLVDEDGPGNVPVTIFESGAILIYLAEKSGRLLAAVGEAERYEVLKWLMIQLTGFGPMCGQYVHFTRFGPPGNDYARNRYHDEVCRLYRVLNRRLAHSEYLGGAEYSIADISMFPWAALHTMMQFSWDELPNLQRWFDLIESRPAVQTVQARLAQQMQLDAGTVASASPQNLERFLGRGIPV